MKTRCSYQLLQLVTLCLASLVGGSVFAQPLDPLDFTSLGTLNLPAGDYTIDTDTLTIFDNTAPGVPLFTGIADDQNGKADYFNGVWDPVANPVQLGIPEIAVFTFDRIDLQPTANVTITGRRAIALLSQGNATIATPLSVDAEVFTPVFNSGGVGGIGGAGGFDGASGFASGSDVSLDDLLPGDGPGGGSPLLDLVNASVVPGGHGGFGGSGRGLSVLNSELQGESYGDLTTVLQGGSGAASTGTFGQAFQGGGGGGAIEINSTKSLRIDAAVSARGGGSDPGTFSAGGSGGGIRLIGSDVAVGAPVVAIGGGTGGGGRVYVEGLVDSIGLTVGQPTLAATTDIDVNSNHLDSAGTLLATSASLDNVGVITLAPATTLVAVGESITFGQGVPVAAPTDTVNYEILVRDARFQSGSIGTIEAGGYTSVYAIELAGETATLTGTGTLTNENRITGTGRIEVPTINAAGGTINTTADSLTFTQSVTNAAGAQVNAIGSTLSFDGGLASDGEINLINSTVYGDVVNDGVASLAGTNTFTGTVSGSGVFTGTGTGAFAGILAPGNSPDLLTFEGDLDLKPSATLEIEIAGTTPGTEHDRVEVGGFATLEGALNVTLLDGFIPELGDSFAFLFASGAFDANFSAINLPDLSAAGLAWELNPGGATLFLEAVPELDGDFNLDGTVNAADYTVWRDGLGTVFTPSDFDVWAANFGDTSPASSASVPEAATGVLLLGCLGCQALRLR